MWSLLQIEYFPLFPAQSAEIAPSRHQTHWLLLLPAGRSSLFCKQKKFTMSGSVFICFFIAYVFYSATIIFDLVLLTTIQGLYLGWFCRPVLALLYSDFVKADIIQTSSSSASIENAMGMMRVTMFLDYGENTFLWESCIRQLGIYQCPVFVLSIKCPNKKGCPMVVLIHLSFPECKPVFNGIKFPEQFLLQAGIPHAVPSTAAVVTGSLCHTFLLVPGVWGLFATALFGRCLDLR